LPLTDMQEKRLRQFASENRVTGKGPLSVVLGITRRAREDGLPLDVSSQLTRGGGQVRGLGQGPVQAILKKYGIQTVLAQEGGRTSRGSVGLMRLYVQFLNGLAASASLDLAAAESWWVDRVKEYLATQPFVLHMDPTHSVRFIVGDLLKQAQKRQSEASGTTILGTVLQHLVGAKLALILGTRIAQHGASVADESTGRTADFHVRDAAIHVTVAPTEALLKKCRMNLNHGLQPILITLSDRAVNTAQQLAEQEGIGDRVDVFDAEQFIASNVHEHSAFARSSRVTTATDLVRMYNGIVAKSETDPGLRIEVS